jgi:hypothetical protein
MLLFLVKVWILFDGFFLFHIPFFDKGFIGFHYICFSDLTCGFLFYKPLIIDGWSFNKTNLFIDLWEICDLLVVLIEQEVVLVLVNVLSNVIHDDLRFLCGKGVLFWLSSVGWYKFTLNEISLCFSCFLLVLSHVILFI